MRVPDTISIELEEAGDSRSTFRLRLDSTVVGGNARSPFFAGIWTRWTSVRKVREGETTNDPFRLPDDRA